MAEEKKFPTPAMLKAREALAKLTPEEKQARENAMRAELKKYYERRPTSETRKLLLGETVDE